jgi:hypothetical protein
MEAMFALTAGPVLFQALTDAAVFGTVVFHLVTLSRIASSHDITSD